MNPNPPVFRGVGSLASLSTSPGKPLRLIVEIQREPEMPLATLLALLEQPCRVTLQGSQLPFPDGDMEVDTETGEMRPRRHPCVACGEYWADGLDRLCNPCRSKGVQASSP